MTTRPVPFGGENMLEEHEGIVIAVTDNIARVKASRHSDCENCGACPGDNALVMDARNSVGAKVGQKVLVKIAETNMLKAAFIVYIMPLLSAAIGAVAGGEATAYFAADFVIAGQIIGGIITFLAAIYLVLRYDRHAKGSTSMQPVVVKILESNPSIHSHL
jgi:sigma-E factor negative regulatory protein RseC